VLLPFPTRRSSDLRLRVEVSARGSITVSDVEGGVVAEADQSSVQVARVAGELVLDSDQGRVEGRDLRATRVAASSDQGRIELEFATSPRAVDVDADQGRIDIVLPDDPDVAYATELDADQGTISDRIRQDPTSDR